MKVLPIAFIFLFFSPYNYAVELDSHIITDNEALMYNSAKDIGVKQICINKQVEEEEAIKINSHCKIDAKPLQWQKNCTKVYNKIGKLPPAAVDYVLDTLRQNINQFSSKECYMYGQPEAYSKGKIRNWSKKKFEQKYMGQGVKNHCTTLINNQDEEAGRCKIKSYYINFCTGEVKSFSTFVGYGTCKRGRGYKNKPNLGTTVIGAFVTGPLFSYKQQYKDYAKHWDKKKKKWKYDVDSHYVKIRKFFYKDKKAKEVRKLFPKKLARRIVPAAELFGLNRSNNRSAPDVKYLHISPYTSAGCVSVPKENYAAVIDIITNGPSIVLNYKKGRMKDLAKDQQLCKQKKSHHR